ncbi:unnamed protein product [Brassica rapa]|uniref:Protein EMBRYONIC FLOWER 1 n=1 Tax=Brassica campestris TaxID=3711 RepID=A0A3P5Z216_BRACM|nr:unnamed protein product [Brassica rapa]VDC68023.1 unnamed protein product [Brassica rapa]
MEPPVKINSISVDLAKAPDEIDSGKCEHFSIRGFVAEIRGGDHRKCWPFSEDSVELRNHESYSLPSLSVVKSRWWRCGSCVKDINVKKINDSDCGLQSHSRSVKEKSIKAGSSAVPSRRRLNWLSVSDKKTKKNQVTAATLLKKVRRRGKDASTNKSKGSKLATPKQVKKRYKESREAVNDGEAFRSSDIAGVVDDTPDKATKKNVMSSHVWEERDNNVSPQSRKLRKTRKVRLLSELLSTKSKETPSKRESTRGRKRKSCGDREDCTSAEMTNYASRILSTMGKTSENASKSCDSGEETRPSVESQSTDSGFNKEGKQRDSRLQVVEADTAQMNLYDYASPVRSSFPGKEMVPCPLHTQRTEKEDTRRKRKAHITDYTKSTIITFSNNNMDDGNLVQPRRTDTLPGTTMPQSTRDFLNSKWLDNSFDRDKYTPQFDDRPFFPLPLQDPMHYKDGDGAMLKGIGTNHFRNFGSSFNSTNADACLRTGVNVNFCSNIDTISSSSLLTDKLRHTSSTEVPYGSCSLQKDISTAHGKGKAPEHIDDIPMEIVELMAKNQYERCLPDREEDKQPTSSVSKNALLIDLNETYDNSMDNNNNTTRQPKPLAWNSDAATKEGQFMAGRQWISSVPFGVVNPPVSQFSGVVRPNSQWISSVPTTMANQQNPFRVLRACNTCQSVQQQQSREASPRPVWVSSTPAHHKPVSLNMQKFMDESTKVENPNTRNLNFTDNNGKQKLGFEGVSSRPLDTCSNESSIPAMHLLSLMDPRLRSNVPVDQSQNTSFAKPPVHQSKEFLGTQPGNSTKQWPFDLYSKRVVTPETSRGIIPPVGTSSISFQSEKTCAENADFRFQASWNHHQEKKDNEFGPTYNNSSQQKQVFTSSSSDPVRFQLLGASDSMKLPLKYHMKDKAKKHKSKNHNSNVSACPPTSTTCGRFVCIISRNPAEFTIPDAPGNVYMIKGEDLKVSKQPSFRKKQNLCKQDALMQNKTSFAPPGAENA